MRVIDILIVSLEPLAVLQMSTLHYKAVFFIGITLLLVFNYLQNQNETLGWVFDLEKVCTRNHLYLKDFKASILIFANRQKLAYCEIHKVATTTIRKHIVQDFVQNMTLKQKLSQELKNQSTLRKAYIEVRNLFEFRHNFSNEDLSKYLTSKAQCLKITYKESQLNLDVKNVIHKFFLHHFFFNLQLRKIS